MTPRLVLGASTLHFRRLPTQWIAIQSYRDQFNRRNSTKPAFIENCRANRKRVSPFPNEPRHRDQDTTRAETDQTSFPENGR